MVRLCPNRTHTQSEFNYHTRSPRANNSAILSVKSCSAEQQSACETKKEAAVALGTNLGHLKPAPKYGHEQRPQLHRNPQSVTRHGSVPFSAPQATRWLPHQPDASPRTYSRQSRTKHPKGGPASSAHEKSRSFRRLRTHPTPFERVTAIPDSFNQLSRAKQLSDTPRPAAPCNSPLFRYSANPHSRSC